MHPYRSLPPERFWRSGVSEKVWSDIAFKGSPRFTIRPGEKIATAGSCFAQHIARRLPELGLTHFVAEAPPPVLSPERARALQYGMFSARYGNVYTARQLRQLIEFAFGERERILLCERAGDGWVDLLRPGLDPACFESPRDLRCDREFHLDRVRAMFLEARHFIFTLGLTEAWHHAGTGIVFPVCPGTRAGTFRPDAHRFANAGVGQVIEDLRWCIEFVRERNPGLKWVLTVSPVALAATASEQHVLVATAASKAILRAAAAEMYEVYDCVEYFPSFEIVGSAASFGQFLDADLRGISSRGVDLVMRAFRDAFVARKAAEPAAAVGAAPVPARPGGVPEVIRAAIAAECDEAFNDPQAR